MELTIFRVVGACSALRLLVTAKFPSLLILVTPMLEALLSSETFRLTKTIRHNIPEDGFFKMCLDSMLEI
jgi:hypothetical protein